MFYLKKFIAALVMPLPLCLAVLAVAWWLLRREAGRRAGRRWLAAGLVALVLLTTGPLPYLGVRLLERPYPTFDPARLDVAPAWIVVLGGGVSDDPGLAPNDRLGRASLARLVEGVRLARHYPEARLLVSGGAVFGTVPEADVMAEVAVLLGVDPERIVRDTASRDTHDQAVNTRARVGAAPLVLVTSAFHMPRAMTLFRGQGLDPVPAPTDHLGRTASGFDFRLALPDGQRLGLVRLAWKEYLGLAWAWLRGQT